MILLNQMHLLNQTVHRAVSAGVLLAGVFMAVTLWFLSYKQAEVDAFNQSSEIAIYLE